LPVIAPNFAKERETVSKPTNGDRNGNELTPFTPHLLRLWIGFFPIRASPAVDVGKYLKKMLNQKRALEALARSG